MAAPTSPYATSSQVAILSQVMMRGATDFTTSTTPTKTEVETMLTWASAQIEHRLAQAGYKIPLAILSGETWPTHQTQWIQLVAALGGASMVSKALKPAPASGPGRQGSRDNVFAQAFTAELNSIWDFSLRRTSTRFRAQYYLGTPIESLLNEPWGPTSDFQQGKYDPTRHLDIWDMTEKVHAIQDAIAFLEVPWDYFYDYQDLDQGLGRTMQEAIAEYGG